MRRTTNSRFMIMMFVVGTLVSSVQGQMHDANPAASQALENIIKAHRTASGIDVETRLQVGAVKGDQEAFEPEMVAHWVIGPDRQLRGEFAGYTIQTGNGKITAIHEARDGLFYLDEDGDSPYYAVQQRFIDLPWPVLAIAIGEDGPNDVAMQLHTRAPWLQPTKVSEIVIDDRRIGRLELLSDYEHMTLDFDPQTFHLLSGETRIHSGPFVEDDIEIMYRYTFTTRSLDGEGGVKNELDLAGRQPADSLAAIARPTQSKPRGRSAPKADAGQMAPALSLPGYKGGTISIEKLRGRMVVIDFWATWCGPCRQALPELATLARWAQENRIPLDVIAVNTSEQSKTLDTRTLRVGEFMKARKEQLKGLKIALDLDGAVARSWGISGLPTTVVLDTDGKIVSRTTGFRPGDGERLKKELLDIFEGGDPEPEKPEKPAL